MMGTRYASVLPLPVAAAKAMDCTLDFHPSAAVG